MKINLIHTNRGFTLIELLVVVSIIGLLSSIVLASVNNARLKSKDALIIQEAKQMQILLEQEYSDTGSYANLQPNYNSWFNLPADCDISSFWLGNYATQARAICKVMVNNSTKDAVGSKFFVGNGYDINNKYSIMVGLPGKKTLLCLGSSGAMSDTETDTNWLSPGCYLNP